MSIPRGIVDVDGVLTRPEEARVSAFDRGLLYGDSAFEVMRTYGGRAFRQRAHLERLARSCERLRIVPPLPADALTARVERAIAHSGQAECYVRVVVTRGVGSLGLEIAPDARPSLLIYALELKLPPQEIYERGIAVGLVHTLRSVDGTPAAGAKTSNYLASMLALDAVKARGAGEALILDASGDIVEGATSNLFVVEGGVLATPPASAGILEGITRRTVIELAARLGLRCEERALTAGDLARASEAFITSSVREIVAVVKADDVPVGDGRPGPFFGRLLSAYRAEAAASSG